MSNPTNTEALRRVENAERELKEARRALEGPPKPPKPEELEVLDYHRSEIRRAKARIDRISGRHVALEVLSTSGVISVKPTEARTIAAKLIECADWLEGRPPRDLSKAKEALHDLMLAATQGAYLQYNPDLTARREREVLDALGEQTR